MDLEKGRTPLQKNLTAHPKWVTSLSGQGKLHALKSDQMEESFSFDGELSLGKVRR